MPKIIWKALKIRKLSPSKAWCKIKRSKDLNLQVLVMLRLCTLSVKTEFKHKNLQKNYEDHPKNQMSQIKKKTEVIEIQR